MTPSDELLLLSSALDASAGGLVIYGARAAPDGGPAVFERRYANAAAARLTGRARDAAPTAADALVFAQVLSTGVATRVEVERGDPAMGRRWVAETVRPIPGGVAVEIEDVTAAHQKAEAADLLVRELAHRFKNVLAVVTSLVALTSRGAEDKASFVQSLRGRLEALSRAHDVISPLRSGEACSVAELLRAALSPYQDPDRGQDAHARIDIDSCDQPLGPAAATSLALLVHELATNALKHGALSSASGRVHLRCQVAGAQLHIAWRESGGPPIAGPPSSNGFGLQMSDRVLTRQLDGTITYHWTPQGLDAEIVVPCARLAD